MLVFTAAQRVKRLLVLIPPAGVHLTRFHGVFAPNAKLRSRVVRTPAPPTPPEPALPKSTARASPSEPRPRLDWASLQRRTFDAEVWPCPCGGRRTVLAVVTSRATAEQVLANLGLLPPRAPRPAAQSPPQLALPL